MIRTIKFEGFTYPHFQAEGNAAKFAIPFALEVCKGVGVDIGYSKPEWKFPGAIGVDNGKICWPSLREEEMKETNADIFNLNDLDYIFSSHCLEHTPQWINTLDYWTGKLKPGGVLFLYLPHPDQVYWRPWNNRKHNHILHPSDIDSYLCGSKNWKEWFVSQRDLNYSFMVMAEKI